MNSLISARFLYLSALLLAGCLLPAGPVLAQSDPWMEQAKLIASDGAASDRFGFSVALDGDTAIVGAWLASVDGNSSQGAAYVFLRNGEDWTEQAKLTAADGAADDLFGHSVAISGNTVLVGASQEFSGSTGATYVFVHDGESWIEQAKLTASDGENGDRFGFSVALSGDTALVGADGASLDSNMQQGGAYVFVRDGGVWTEQTRLVPDDLPISCAIAVFCPKFGNSVALWEGTALIGARNMTVDGVRSGAAYVFVRSGETWSEQARLTRVGGAFGENFGASVALRGDTALVGASTVAVDGNSAQGAAHVFTRNGSTWVEQQELTASDGAEFDNFGSSVSLIDGFALIGAAQATVDGNTNQGAAYIFTSADGAWSEQQKLTALDGAGNDRFGTSVAISIGTALIGARDAAIDGNSRQGAAYVFAAASAGDPVLSFDPAALDFGQVGVGAASTPQTATLTNSGDSDATGLIFNTPGSGFAADTADCGDLLAAGTSCEVSVTFTPPATGAAAATLTADSDQAVSADLALSGEGIEPAQLSFTPATLDFGNVDVGTTSDPLDTTLSNTGDSDATGLSFSTPGSGFSVVGNTCGAVLPAGGNCLLSLTFTPPTAGPASDTLTVDGDNEVSASLNLSGNGEEPPEPGVLSVTPAVLDFGDVFIGTTDTGSITVSNAAEAGAETLTLSSFGLTGDDGFSFIFGSGSCNVGTQLPPGENCTLEIEFSPGSEGDFLATLLVDTDDGQNASVDLSGSGIEPPPSAEWPLQAELIPSEGDSQVPFGWSVAIDGGTALIGSIDSHNDVLSKSKAWVYVRDGETWSEQTILVPAEHPLVCPEVSPSTGFGRECPHFGYSVALSGDVAVVGQPASAASNGNPEPNHLQGAAYVFVRQGDQWIEQAKLMASDGGADDNFGHSVAIDGDTIVVGAPMLRAERPGRPLEPHGAAYVFVRDGDAWVEQARLDPDDFPLMCRIVQGQSIFGCPQYGVSVAIDGETVLVGAEGAEVDGNDRQGVVYAFTREGGTWSQQARLEASDGSFGHRFGTSVAVRGDTALMGAGSAGDEQFPNDNPGAVYVFTRSGETWTERQRLMASDGTVFALFGSSVALESDGTALVGANRTRNAIGDNEGAAYLYVPEGGIWNEQQRFRVPPTTNCSTSGSGCKFGNSVALSGNTALVGATGVWDAETTVKHGAAYVFVGADPDLGFLPASLNFGTVPLGQTSDPQTTTLRNNSEQDLTGLAFTTPGEGFIANTSTCGTTLAVGESCVISVTFTPSAEGPASATLQVDSDQALSTSLSLSGSSAEMPDQIFHHRFEDGGAQ